MPKIDIGGLGIPSSALRWKFTHASGPGGQNVNKVSTAAECRLRLDAAGLPDPVRRRLEKLAGSRLNAAGEILVFADTQRSQVLNRKAALARLAALIQQARKTPKPRLPTAPPAGVAARRREDKRRRSAAKERRQTPRIPEEGSA